MIPVNPDAVKLFHAGLQALSRVECAGMRVDTDYLSKAIEKVQDRIDVVEDRMKGDEVWEVWRRRYGKAASLTSRPQLGVVLFEEMGFAPVGITAKGKASTDGETLETVDLDFVRDLVQVDKLRKLKGTYLQGLQRCAVDGFVHGFIQLHTARTYRSSMVDPNLQNVPIRDPDIGKIIRRAFRSRFKGGRICEADFSAIEVRVATCYHKDPVMVRYIEEDYDMHSDMSRECYLLGADEVTKPVRQAGKNSYVFPAFYGSAYFQVAAGLWGAIIKGKLQTAQGVPLMDHLASQGITSLGACDPKKEAADGTFEQHLQGVDKRFWKDRFKVYDKWRRDWYAAYLKKAGFSTLTGFALNGVLKRNDVINYPVQGSAFHCLLWALTEIQKILIKRGMKTVLICQIHDSILADVAPGEMDDYVEIAVEVMTRKIRQRFPWLCVPLGIEIEACGPDETWHDKKKILEAK